MHLCHHSSGGKGDPQFSTSNSASLHLSSQVISFHLRTRLINRIRAKGIATILTQPRLLNPPPSPTIKIQRPPVHTTSQRTRPILVRRNRTLQHIRIRPRSSYVRRRVKHHEFLIVAILRRILLRDIACVGSIGGYEVCAVEEEVGGDVAAVYGHADAIGVGA